MNIKNVGIVVLLICILLFDTFFVDGDSMEQTLSDGEFVIGKKFSSIRNNDIVKLKKKDEIYIKRVYASPGDEVVCNNTCTINGVKSDIIIPNPVHCILKEDEYIVIGDNYQNSIDSRNFGIVKKNEIKSELLFHIF